MSSCVHENATWRNSPILYLGHAWFAMATGGEFKQWMRDVGLHVPIDCVSRHKRIGLLKVKLPTAADVDYWVAHLSTVPDLHASGKPFTESFATPALGVAVGQ